MTFELLDFAKLPYLNKQIELKIEDRRWSRRTFIKPSVFIICAIVYPPCLPTRVNIDTALSGTNRTAESER